MPQLDKLAKIAFLLVLIGGINCLFVGLFRTDVLSMIFGIIPFLPRLIYLVIGVSAVYLAYAGWKAKTLW